MKKILAIIVCVLFVAGLNAQSRFAVPVRTIEEKNQNLIFQMWLAGFGGGINFAKAHGTTPYEYGVYLGKMFAPGWGEPGNFDNLVNGWLRNLEDMRVATDPPLLVKENQDGSVSITTSEQMFHQYFPENNGVVSFSEYLDFMKGIFNEISDYLGAKANIENKDGLIVFTYTKK